MVVKSRLYARFRAIETIRNNYYLVGRARDAFWAGRLDIVNGRVGVGRAGLVWLSGSGTHMNSFFWWARCGYLLIFL